MSHVCNSSGEYRPSLQVLTSHPNRGFVKCHEWLAVFDLVGPQAGPEA